MSVQAVQAVARVDVPLDDVLAGARFFRQVLALPVHVHDRDRADVDLAPDLVAHLHTIPRPLSPAGSGPPAEQPATIVQLRVPDLAGALGELRRRGATVLVEPVLTDWGTESAFVA